MNSRSWIYRDSPKRLCGMDYCKFIMEFGVLLIIHYLIREILADAILDIHLIRSSQIDIGDKITYGWYITVHVLFLICPMVQMKTPLLFQRLYFRLIVFEIINV
jgi:hypothetical protein